MSTGPDFLCIGAPKSGTTWLYCNLKAHPSVWLPPVKELHYFNTMFPLPRYGVKRNDPKGLLGIFGGYSRRKIIHSFGAAVRRKSVMDFVWVYRYFSGPQSDNWYLSLFSGQQGVVTGDLTTDYCALSEDAVRHVGCLIPNAKIVFLMRNPIERAWSHAKMLLPELLGKSVTEITTSEYIDYLQHSAPRLRGNYPRTITVWERVFGRKQMLYAFFEEVADCPRDLFARVISFLGDGRLNDYFPDTLEKKVNVSEARSMQNVPDTIYPCLRELYGDDIECLANRFGSYASKWYENME